MPINHCWSNICLHYQTRYRSLFLICFVVKTIDSPNELMLWMNVLRCTQIVLLYICAKYTQRSHALASASIMHSVLYECYLLQRMKWLFDVCVRLFDSHPAMVLQYLHRTRCDFTLCCEFISCVSKSRIEPACLYLSGGVKTVCMVNCVFEPYVTKAAKPLYC